jgi:hypothetical protein
MAQCYVPLSWRETGKGLRDHPGRHSKAITIMDVGAGAQVFHRFIDVVELVGARVEPIKFDDADLSCGAVRRK